MAAVGLVTAIANPALEAIVIGALRSRGEDVVVVRRCVEVADALAVVASGAARVVVIGEGLAGLDADIVASIASYGAVPAAICEPGAHWPDRYRIPVRLDASSAADDLAEVIVELAHGGAVQAAAQSAAAPPTEPARLGKVVCVWGPAGAPGRSTVALGLADEAARLGTPTLLIDADSYGGSAATMLGLLDESPGIAAACRAAGAGSLDAVSLARTCLQVGPALRVLTGISRSDRWPELRPAALETVIDQARSMVGLTVIDCGFSIEQDEELVYDTMAPRRNGATITALEQADEVLLVTGCDPVSVTRGVRAVQELRELLPAAEVRVVVNKVRGSVFSGDPVAQLQEAFDRFAGVAVSALLPWEGKGCDTAMLRGRMLAEVAPSSGLRKSLVALAESVAAPAVRRPRRRGRRVRAG